MVKNQPREKRITRLKQRPCREKNNHLWGLFVSLDLENRGFDRKPREKEGNLFRGKPRKIWDWVRIKKLAFRE